MLSIKSKLDRLVGYTVDIKPFEAAPGITGILQVLANGEYCVGNFVFTYQDVKVLYSTEIYL